MLLSVPLILGGEVTFVALRELQKNAVIFVATILGNALEHAAVCRFKLVLLAFADFFTSVASWRAQHRGFSAFPLDLRCLADPSSWTDRGVLPIFSLERNCKIAIAGDPPGVTSSPLPSLILSLIMCVTLSLTCLPLLWPGQPHSPPHRHVHQLPSDEREQGPKGRF